MRKDPVSKFRFACAVVVAGVAIPLSLIAGPAARAAVAQGGRTAVPAAVSDSRGLAAPASSAMARPATQAASPQADDSAAVVTPASGAPGITVSASGTNWTPGDHIQAAWGDDNSDLGSPVLVASGGTFTDSFAIPAKATAGSHQVLFTDQESRYFEIASFNVTSASPASSPSPRRATRRCLSLPVPGRWGRNLSWPGRAGQRAAPSRSRCLTGRRASSRPQAGTRPSPRTAPGS